MNIGIFTDTYYPEINGVANSVYQLKNELEKRGHQVYVFTASNPDITQKEHHVYRMKSVPFFLMKDRRVSFYVTKMWYQTVAGLHLDIIHTQTEFVMGHMGRKLARKFGIPLVHTYHTIYEDYTHYLRVPGNEKLKGLIRLFSKSCCEKADQVIVPTEKVKELLDSYGVRRPVFVQPTGICLSKFGYVNWNLVTKIRSQYGLTEKHHILLSIGRISQEKNLKEIITFAGRMARKDPDLRLFIVGDGPERENLQDFVREENLTECVIFAGEVPWDKIQNYYAAGDVFVSGSTSETQGLTYAEALACGKPLLVRQDDCLAGILCPGRNGYAYRNEQEFEEGYRNLFEREEYLAMRDAARRSIVHLSSQEFGAGVEKIYINLCHTHGMYTGKQKKA